jgi:hypothetical protein
LRALEASGALIDLTIIILYLKIIEFSKNYLPKTLYVKEIKEISCASSMLKKITSNNSESCI